MRNIFLKSYRDDNFVSVLLLIMAMLFFLSFGFNNTNTIREKTRRAYREKCVIPEKFEDIFRFSSRKNKKNKKKRKGFR